jgi:hypothetical protein
VCQPAGWLACGRKGKVAHCEAHAGAAPRRCVCRIQRDVSVRGRDVGGVIEQYTSFVKPAFDQFVAPSRKFADVIIPWARCGAALLLLLPLLVPPPLLLPPSPSQAKPAPSLWPFLLVFQAVQGPPPPQHTHTTTTPGGCGCWGLMRAGMLLATSAGLLVQPPGPPTRLASPRLASELASYLAHIQTLLCLRHPRGGLAPSPCCREYWQLNPAKDGRQSTPCHGCDVAPSPQPPLLRRDKRMRSCPAPPLLLLDLPAAQGRQRGSDRPDHGAHPHEAAAARPAPHLFKPGGHTIQLPGGGGCGVMHW